MFTMFAKMQIQNHSNQYLKRYQFLWLYKLHFDGLIGLGISETSLNIWAHIVTDRC